VSFQDIPHTFVLSYLYELPAGPGKKYFNHGVAGKVLGGWQVSGVHRYQNGSPLVINEFATSPNFTGGNYRFKHHPRRAAHQPERIVVQSLRREQRMQKRTPTEHSQPEAQIISSTALLFLDPNASAALVAQQGYVFGNLPVAFAIFAVRVTSNEDFAIIKRTSIVEGQNIIFKLDIPNAFNRHVFGGIDGNPTSSTFGVPGGGNHSVLNAARQIQITLRYQF